MFVIHEISSGECRELVARNRLARLACSMNNQPYLVPIHYAYADEHLYSFSLVGQKVVWMRENPKVCIQVDEFQRSRQWSSVILYGTFEELPDRIGWKSQREHAWSLLQKHANWWEPGGARPVGKPGAIQGSHVFYRVKIQSMTGRKAVNERMSPE